MSSGANADLYGTLGVPRDASAREIRRAYRRLARRQHPDRNPDPDGSRQFATLASAYEILHDPARRARYDQTLGLSVSPIVPARSAPRPPTWAVRSERPYRRGTLELSPVEAVHLTRQPLTFRDARGREIVLPAGTGDGDQISLLRDGQAVILTVRVRAKT